MVDLAGDLGFKNYKVVLSPSACAVCRRKTNNGAKVFGEAEVMQKAGEYGKFVPFHPNCYCVAVPFVP